MSLNRKTLCVLSVVSAAVLLAACGGGGGAAPTATVLPTPPVVPADSNGAVVAPNVALQTSVPTSTYLAGSEELAAFTALNDARLACGFGAVKQDTRLDAAAKGHADWLLLNGYRGHNQVISTIGFTGVTPEDRVVNAGYSSIGTAEIHDELAGLLGTSSKTGYGVNSVAILLNAPMHARSMLSGVTDAGTAVRSSLDVATSPGGARVNSMFDLAYRKATGPQEVAAGTLVTYPCDGRTNIMRQLNEESPNPVPGRDLALNPLGSSIQLRTRTGSNLRLATYAMVEQATGVSVVVRPPVGAQYSNEPYPNTTAELGLHETWIAADAPLKANTAYIVTLGGTLDGKAFSRVFTFTTGI